MVRAKFFKCSWSMFVSFPHPSLLRPFDPLAPFCQSPFALLGCFNLEEFGSNSVLLGLLCTACAADQENFETAQARLRYLEKNLLFMFGELVKMTGTLS